MKVALWLAACLLASPLPARAAAPNAGFGGGAAFPLGETSTAFTIGPHASATLGFTLDPSTEVDVDLRLHWLGGRVRRTDLYFTPTEVREKVTLSEGAVGVHKRFVNTGGPAPYLRASLGAAYVLPDIEVSSPYSSGVLPSDGKFTLAMAGGLGLAIPVLTSEIRVEALLHRFALEPDPIDDLTLSASWWPHCRARPTAR